MEKLIGAFVIFTISIVLFLIGYNATFNTVKTISKFISYAKYEEGPLLPHDCIVWQVIRSKNEQKL